MSDSAPKKKGLLAKLLSAIVVLAVILAVLVLAVCMSLGTTVKTVGQTVVTKLTKGETHIGNADISLLRGRVTIEDILIKNPAQNAAGEAVSFKNDAFFKLAKIDIDLNIRSLLSDTIEVREIIIDAPDITYEKTPLNDSNLHVILANLDAATGPKTDDPKKEAPAPDAEEDAAPGKKVVIGHLLITNAAVNLSSCGLTAPLHIPKVELKDLGKEEEGVSVADAISETFTTLFTSIFDGVKNLGVAVMDIGKNAGKKLMDAGAGLKDAGKNLIENVKLPNPFKK